MFWIIILYLIKGTIQADPCFDYTSITDNDRAPGYSASIGCDHYVITGGNWYRAVSKSGGEMPEKPPPFGSCGTTFPIWFSGTHPKQVGDINDKGFACIEDMFQGPCGTKLNMSVKKCNGYFVYKLPSVSACPSRFCFGTKVPCGPGTNSDSGFEPCGHYPNVTLKPRVKVGLSLDNATLLNCSYEQVSFTCDILPTQIARQYLTDIFWYINDKEVLNFTRLRSMDVANASLLEQHWRGTYKLSFTVKCGVRVRTSSNGIPTPLSYSNPFYAGIKTDKSTYMVSKGADTPIRVSLTIPFGRLVNQSQNTTCDYHPTLVLLVITSTGICNKVSNVLSQLEFQNNNSCGVNFRHTDITIENNEFKSIKSKILNVQVRGNNVVPINTITPRYINLTVLPNNFLRAWNDASFSILLNIDNGPSNTAGKMCYSRNDPHMQTFDGKRYENQDPGEFILFRNGPAQVNAMFSPCNGKVFCNCGVAIRYANSLFIANFCGAINSSFASIVGKQNRYIEKRCVDESHMKIRSNGDLHTITLPSGTEVEFRFDNVYGYFGIHTIFIKPSSSDFGKTEGLCGNFDNNPDNDYKLPSDKVIHDYDVFRMQWREQNTSKSLFNINVVLEDTYINVKHLLGCANNKGPRPTIAAVNNHNVLFNLSQTDMNCKVKVSSYFSSCPQHHRRKRSVYNEDHTIEKFPVDVFNGNFTPKSFSWSNGWTEEKANHTCTNALTTIPLHSKCTKAIPILNADAYIKSCILDIKYTGGTSWLQVTVEAFKQSCIMEARRYENLTISQNGGKSILEDLMDNACFNNCSRAGVCKSGQCVCTRGHYGGDCSKTLDKPPSVDLTTNPGLCDLTRKSCYVLSLSGYGFIDQKLTCRLQSFKILPTGLQNETSHVHLPGKYMNTINMQCIIPENHRRKRSTSGSAIMLAEGYFISISNDGVHFSSPMPYIIHNSTCFTCDITTLSCSRKASCPISYMQPVQAHVAPNVPVSGPCANYKRINDPQRSVTYNLKPNDPKRCDHFLQSGWYRFHSTSDEDLATFCPGLGTCGTILPVWLNGSIPRVSDGISDMNVCVHGYRECCEETWPVQVLNCGPYRVYNLRGTKGCPERYCSKSVSTLQSTAWPTQTLIPGWNNGVLGFSTNNGQADNDGTKRLTMIIGLTVCGIVVVITAVTLAIIAIKKYTQQNNVQDISNKFHNKGQLDPVVEVQFIKPKQ